MPKEQWRYNGSVDCYRKILAADGIAGLWVGAIPNIMRNSIINTAELASYDQYKQILTGVGFGEGVSTHVMCAFGSGFNAVVVGSPVDVLKTRLMNKVPGQSGNPFTMIGTIMSQEGPMAFYKGFTTNFMRIGSWNVIMFVTLEQIKKQWDAGKK